VHSARCDRNFPSTMKPRHGNFADRGSFPRHSVKRPQTNLRDPDAHPSPRMRGNDMRIVLDYRGNFLCVLTESETPHGSGRVTLVREWCAGRRADEAGVRTLIGRPVTEADSAEGIYVDEDGNGFS
jgi:hypothetical protein